MALTRTAGPTQARNTTGASAFTIPNALNVTTGQKSIFLGLNFRRSTNPTAVITSVTIGGAAMTAVNASVAENTTLSPGEATIFYKLENHGLAAGQKTLAVDFDQFVDGIAVCSWEYGGTVAPVADKSNQGTGAGANASLGLTAVAANAAILSMHAANADPTAGSGFTLVNVDNLAWFTSAEYDDDADGAGDKTVAYTHASADWVMSAMSVKEGAGTLTITDAGDEQYNPGETGINIVGTLFGASQGSGAVYLSPTNNVSDSNRVAQTVTGWNDTSVVITVAAGTLLRDTDLYLFVVNNAGQSNASGYVVQIAATGPHISDAGDEQFTAGETGVVITGLRFGASQGAGEVVICPTNDVEDAGAVVQTVTAWGDTSITITTVRGALNFLTGMFLFVIADDGESNPQGYSVQFVPRVYIREQLSNLTGANVTYADDIRAVVYHALPAAASPNPAQVLDNITRNGTGLTNQEVNRGSLAVNDPIYVALFGTTSPFPATAKRIVPVYE